LKDENDETGEESRNIQQPLSSPNKTKRGNRHITPVVPYKLMPLEKQHWPLRLFAVC